MREILGLICALPDIKTNTPLDDLEYIDAWKKVAVQVTYYLEECIPNIYYKEEFSSKILGGFFNKTLPTNYLLPIILDLIPDDIGLLVQAKEKLKIAAAINLGGLSLVLSKDQKHFANIASAIEIKIAGVEIEQPKKELDRTRKVINEVRRFELVRKCKNIIDSLMRDLERSIRANYFDVLEDLYFGSKSSNIEAIFKQMHDDILEELFPLIDGAAETIGIRKYMALRDIYCTLIRSEFPHKQIANLLNQLNGLSSILHQQSDNHSLRLVEDICTYLRSLPEEIHSSPAEIESPPVAANQFLDFFKKHIGNTTRITGAPEKSRRGGK